MYARLLYLLCLNTHSKLKSLEDSKYFWKRDSSRPVKPDWTPLFMSSKALSSLKETESKSYELNLTISSELRSESFLMMTVLYI